MDFRWGRGNFQMPGVSHPSSQDGERSSCRVPLSTSPNVGGAPLFCVPGRGAWPTLRVGKPHVRLAQGNVTDDRAFLRSIRLLWKNLLRKRMHAPVATCLGRLLQRNGQRR